VTRLRTRTLAEVYARQGHLDEALAILDELVQARPDDEELRRRRVEVRDELRKRRDAGDEAARREARVETLRALLRRVRKRRRAA
jgi:pentatricopeptide repeat protein